MFQRRKLTFWQGVGLKWWVLKKRARTWWETVLKG